MRLTIHVTIEVPACKANGEISIMLVFQSLVVANSGIYLRTGKIYRSRFIISGHQSNAYEIANLPVH